MESKGAVILILGTSAEDTLTELDNISFLYPILNLEKSLIPHHLAAKWFCTPSRSLRGRDV